jgi:tetratricopeptide (TPR) repeat protein
MSSLRWICLLTSVFLPPAVAVGQNNAAPRQPPMREQIDFNKALVELNEALRLNPKDAVALASRARLFLQMGRNREAILDASASIQLVPNNAGAYGTRGLAYDRLGQFAAAIADYTASIRLHPTALKYMLRGRCHEMVRQHNQAIADFKEGNRLQMASENSSATTHPN